MTMPYSPSRAVYEGNGAATDFPFAFKVWSADQLNVSLTSPQGASSSAQGWSASIGESGGTVTYQHEGAPLPAGWRLAIVRNMPFAQGIDLVSASRFDPQVIEDGLDQATAELQQLNEQLARAVIMPATSDQSPEEVVAAIYASRAAAAASASTASAQATAAAESANIAAQAVATATTKAVADATVKADAAAISAAEAAQSALDAISAIPENLVARVEDIETANTQQDARLDDVESGITAISTSLIGSVISVLATAGYVPNGTVPADGAEYSRAQFTEFYDSYLSGAAKLLTCTYAAFAAQVALTGNCAKFALDADNHTFKVPLLKDGDSVTQAASAAEIGKSVKAGLPNITGEASRGSNGDTGFLDTTAVISGVFKKGSAKSYLMSGSAGTGYSLVFDASVSGTDPIYGKSTTVTDEQVRLRHFVVVASAQNNASIFDWSNYMAALAGKLNADMSNRPANLPYVTESYTNGANWYRLWSDGLIEQGGNVSSGATTGSISLLKSYSSLKYGFYIGLLGGNGGYSSNGGMTCAGAVKTISSITWNYTGVNSPSIAAGNFDWWTRGY